MYEIDKRGGVQKSLSRTDPHEFKKISVISINKNLNPQEERSHEK